VDCGRAALRKVLMGTPGEGLVVSSNPGCSQVCAGSVECFGARVRSLAGQWNTKAESPHQTPPQMAIIASAPKTQLIGPTIANPIMAASTFRLNQA
jgi:hypothetical protein